MQMSISGAFWSVIRKIYLSLSIFGSRGVSYYAASSSFYFLFSIIPLAMFFIIIVDTIFSGYANISDTFFQLLSPILPNINKDSFKTVGLFDGTVKSVAGLIGGVALLWSSRSVFKSVNMSFNVIFNTVSKRNFIMNNLISLTAVPIIIVACIVFITAGFVLRNLDTILAKLDIPYLSTGNLLSSSSNVTLVLFVFAMAFLLYKYLPTVKIKPRYAVVGAVLFTLSAIAMQSVLKGVVQLGQYYLVYGVISGLLVALFWVNMTCALLYLCAQLVYVLQYSVELELAMFYTRVMKGDANFIEKFLFGKELQADHDYGVHYRAGDTIIKIGAAADYFYILRKGHVEQTNNNALFSDTLSVGAIFGTAAITSKSGYVKTAVAVTDCFVLKLPKEMYSEIIKIDATFSESVLKAI